MTIQTIKAIKGFRDEYFFLSNFSASSVEITYEGRTFTMSTGEHVFHAMKIAARPNASSTENSEYLTAMQYAKTPAKAKYFGRSIAIDPQRWDEISYQCMQRTVELKFSQNSLLRQKLLATGNAELVEENTWGDRLWGTVDGEGKNQLGIILSTYRDSIK